MPNYIISTKKGEPIELKSANLKILAEALKKCRVKRNEVIGLTVQTGPRG